MRGKIRQFLVDVTVLFPQVTLQVSFENIQSVLPKTAPNPSKEIVNSKSGFSTVTSMTFLEWESATSVFEWVVGALKADVKRSEAVIQNMRSLLNALLGMSIQDPLIQTRYLHILGCLKPLYECDTNSLNLVLQKVQVCPCFIACCRPVAIVNSYPPPPPDCCLAQFRFSAIQLHQPHPLTL